MSDILGEGGVDRLHPTTCALYSPGTIRLKLEKSEPFLIYNLILSIY